MTVNRTTYKRLDILTPEPTATGADMLQDDIKLIDDVIAAIPGGGTAGQILEKTSAVDYATQWADKPSTPAVDSSLSATSTNPVQNAVVTTAINGKADTAHTHTYSAITGTPTNVSSFTNDAGYLTSHQDISGKADTATTLAGYNITDAYTKTEIDAKAASVYRYKGNVASYASLPSTGNITGDVYNLTDTGANCAWTGSAWDKLSETIDLTAYATTASLATVATTGAYSDLTGTPTIPEAYTLPTASTSTLGGVKVDGTTITSSSDGTISAVQSGVSSIADPLYSNSLLRASNYQWTEESPMDVSAATNVDSVLARNTDLSGFSWLALSAISGGSSTLSGLTDVTISSASSGQALVYNGSGWVNGTTTGSGGTKVVTESGNTSLQSVTNLTPTYPGNTRGNGAVDLQQSRNSNIRVASGNYSVAMGNSNIASASCSVAMGSNNYATGNYSIAMGYNNYIYNTYSVAMGYFNNIYNPYSVAMGNSNIASASCSVAMGGNNYVSGNYSVAMGCCNTATDEGSMAVGRDNTVSGSFSIVSGAGCKLTKTGVVGTNVNFNKVNSTYGHAGFKGIVLDSPSDPIMPFDVIEAVVLRIQVISMDSSSVMTMGEAVITISSSSIIRTLNVFSDVILTFTMSAGSLYLSSVNGGSYSNAQVGVWYTVHNNISSGSSSSSSGSGSSSSSSGS